MATGEWQGIEGYSISVPMFFIDRPAFLDVLAAPSGEEENTPEKPHLMTMKMHNLPAKKAFRCITILVEMPEVAKALVTEGLNESTLPNHLVGYYNEVLTWAKEILSRFPDIEGDAELTHRNKTRRTQILIWFRRISELANAPIHGESGLHTSL